MHYFPCRTGDVESGRCPFRLLPMTLSSCDKVLEVRKGSFQPYLSSRSRCIHIEQRFFFLINISLMNFKLRSKFSCHTVLYFLVEFFCCLIRLDKTLFDIMCTDNLFSEIISFMVVYHFAFPGLFDLV